MSVALHLPPLAPVGITFEWQDDELVVKAFVNLEGERARAAGVVIGSALAAINGNSLQGWAFPELVAAIKSAASRSRTLVFSPSRKQLAAIRQDTSERHLMADLNVEDAALRGSTCNSVLVPYQPRKRSTTKMTAMPSHNDPFSTPSRRRRVYLQVVLCLLMG